MPECVTNHTFLLNSVIAMTKQSDQWPTPLFDMGYRIEWVNQSFKIGDLGNLKPDILCKIFEKNRVLLLECKGGSSINRKQLEKYLGVEGQHLQTLISVRDPVKIGTIFAYVVKSRDELIEELGSILPEIDEKIRGQRNQDDIDVIEIQANMARVWTQKRENWSSDIVDGIPFEEGAFPQHYIPFSLDDDGEWILKLIARELVLIISRKGKIEPNPNVGARELVESVFRAYEFLPESEIKLLGDRMKHYFEKLTKKKRLQKRIESIGKGDRISVISLKGAIEELEKYGKEVFEEEQTTGRLDEI